MPTKVEIRGRKYDLEDTADLTSIQAVLVPDNWPGKKGDCVRNFLATQNMLALQLRRHLAANFKTICKTAQEAVAEGENGKVKINFGFEVDQTSPMVVALSGLKLSFSVSHFTKGKPQTYDLTQSELPLDDDMQTVLDTKGTEAESEELQKSKAEAKAEEPPADAAVGDDVTPENTPGDAPAASGKPKKRRSKKK